MRSVIFKLFVILALGSVFTVLAKDPFSKDPFSTEGVGYVIATTPDGTYKYVVATPPGKKQKEAGTRIHIAKDKISDEKSEAFIIKKMKFDEVNVGFVIKALSIISEKNIFIDPGVLGDGKAAVEVPIYEGSFLEGFKEVKRKAVNVRAMLNTPISVFIQKPSTLEEVLNVISKQYKLIAVPEGRGLYRITVYTTLRLDTKDMADPDIQEIIKIAKRVVSPSAEIVWDRSLKYLTITDAFDRILETRRALENYIQNVKDRVKTARVYCAEGPERQTFERAQEDIRRKVIEAIQGDLSSVGRVSVSEGCVYVTDRFINVLKNLSKWRELVRKQILQSQEAVITRVFYIKNLSLDEAKQLLLPYISKQTVITEAPTFRALVVTDKITRIRKYEEVLSEFLAKAPSARKPVTQIFYLKYISPEEFIKMIEPIRSEAGIILTGGAVRTEEGKDKEGGKVTPIIREFNAVMITDYPEVIERIREEFRDYISEVPPQVKIEAKIVEARKEVLEEIGINWSTLLSNVRAPQSWRGGVGVNLGVGQTGPLTPGVSATPGGILTFTYSSGMLNALNLRLSAFERVGKVRAVAKPTVVTVNGKKAVIKQGQEIPYQTAVIAGGGSVASITFKEAVLKLEVLPIISPDGRILLDITLTRDTPGVQTPIGPAINKNEVNTKVIVQSGDTVVIGGIIDSLDRDTREGVARLVRVPVLRWLFGQKIRELQDIELLIFITPTLITE